MTHSDEREARIRPIHGPCCPVAGPPCHQCRACLLTQVVLNHLGAEPCDDIDRAARFALWRDPQATARDVADLVQARRERAWLRGG